MLYFKEKKMFRAKTNRQIGLTSPQERYKIYNKFLSSSTLKGGTKRYMQNAISDLADSCNQDIFLELNLSQEHVKDDLKFLRELRKFLKRYNKNTSQIDYLIKKIEEDMGLEKAIQIYDIDEYKIKKSIEKHPYFKNPCNYPIRLITIMKYLKKKGINMHYTDIDLIVDRLIQEIEDVHKVGEGMYIKKNL